MNFISLASVRYQVDIHSRIVQELRRLNVKISFSGISTDLWYEGDASSCYIKNGAVLTELARPSGRRTSWWTTDSIQEEFYNSIKVIQKQVDSLISREVPEVLFIDDDTGPLEVLIINCFKKNKIPVVLFEHGYGFALGKTKSKPETRLFHFKDYLKQFFISLRNKESVIVQPFGQNGEDKVLCLSEWTKNVHEKYGVESQKLSVTGNPYYDILLEKRDKQRRYTPNMKILICSTGEKKFGRIEELSFFLALIKNICKQNKSYVFELRPKNNETFDFNDVLINELMQFDNFSIGDSTKPFYDIAGMYDAVISNRNSLIALECLILGIPALLYGKNSTHLDYSGKAITSLDEIYIASGLKTIELQNPDGYIEKYITDWNQNGQVLETIINNITHYFGPIDGCCGNRVAEEILGISE